MTHEQQTDLSIAQTFIDAIEAACVIFAIVALLFLAVVNASAQDAAPSAHYGKHGAALLPDRERTPGAIRTTDAHAVCHGGSTTQFRHTTSSMKAKSYALYGATKKAGVCCEVDHLISLELGGADDPKNLWPEPYEPRPGAHEKDAVENWLHAQVCAGKITLPAAQHAIASDWYAVYETMQRNK